MFRGSLLWQKKPGGWAAPPCSLRCVCGAHVQHDNKQLWIMDSQFPGWSCWYHKPQECRQNPKMASYLPFIMKAKEKHVFTNKPMRVHMAKWLKHRMRHQESWVLDPVLPVAHFSMSPYSSLPWLLSPSVKMGMTIIICRVGELKMGVLLIHVSYVKMSRGILVVFPILEM